MTAAPSAAARRTPSRPTAERELVAAVRAELAAIEPARACCRRAARAGLGVAGSGARQIVVGRLVHRLGPPSGFDWPSAAGHCRAAFLRGLFLARGSLSLAGRRTHLEFLVPVDEMDAAAGWLADIDLPAASRVRRGQGVLTWKSAETVLRFLRLVGAAATTLELESMLVHRSLYGHLNRVVNAESANLRRSVASSRRQLAGIRLLAHAGRLERLPAEVRAVARARQESPAATFSELAATVGLSRPQVQRALAHLEQLALHLDEAEPAGDR